MAFSSDQRSKLNDAQAQIERLREQVESMMKDRVTPAVAEYAGRAQSALGSARSTVQDQADMVSGRVKQQPLVAIAIAAAVGWIIGRAMR